MSTQREALLKELVVKQTKAIEACIKELHMMVETHIHITGTHPLTNEVCIISYFADLFWLVEFAELYICICHFLGVSVC